MSGKRGVPMNTRNKIALNFFALTPREFNFTVYRRLCEPSERKEDFPSCYKRRLPVEEMSSSGDYKNYWVLYEPTDGFNENTCQNAGSLHSMH